MPVKGHRYEHLDAMRGYAALAVAFCHSVATFNGAPERDLIGGMAGRVPVLFFFILSGFVLGKSLQREENFGFKSYIAFYTRRLFRLYPPYVASLILAIVLQKVWIHAHSTFNGPLNVWVMITARGMASLSSVVDYAKDFLLDDMRLNGVAWALRAEFICSLFLPLLHLYTQRRPNLVPGILLFLIVLRLPLSVDPHSAFTSLQYLFIFYLGYLISRADLSWVEKVGYSKWSYVLPYGLIILALAMRRYPFDDLSAAFFLSGFFVLLVPDYIPGLRAVLHAPFSRLLGKCSFSFYLVFTPVLTAVMYGSGWSFPQQPLVCGLTVFVMSVGFALPIAVLMEKVVESPFNRMGHWVSDQIHPQRRNQTQVANAIAVG